MPSPRAQELRQAYETEDVSKQVIDTARKLEGLRRQHSVHAAGVVIGREPLTNICPVQRTDGDTVTQYEMGAIEQIGLLKMDFLGLRNLTVIGDTILHMKDNRGVEVDPDRLDLSDPLAYKLLQDGNTAGVFQMESGGMTRLCRQLRPDRFEEIAALIALYRPGPMDEIPRYVKGKHDPTSVTFFHPLLTEVLADTNGVIVYQEQVTEILQVVGGIQPARRRHDPLCHRQEEDLGAGQMGGAVPHRRSGGGVDRPGEPGLVGPDQTFRRVLVQPGARQRVRPGRLPDHLAEGQLPGGVSGGLLTSAKDRNDKMPMYLAETRTMGVKVLPPSVNDSDLDFKPRGDDILFGLSAIRNVGESVAERLITARRKGGPFSSFDDFCRRVDPSCLNKKVIESLAKAGGFDCLGVKRAPLLDRDPKNGGLCMSERAARLVEAVLAERKAEEAGQYSFFAGEPETPNFSAPGVTVAFDGVGDDIPQSDLLKAEKEMLGFYVSEHPLAAIEGAIQVPVRGRYPSTGGRPGRSHQDRGRDPVPDDPQVHQKGRHLVRRCPGRPQGQRRGDFLAEHGERNLAGTVERRRHRPDQRPGRTAGRGGQAHGVEGDQAQYHRGGGGVEDQAAGRVVDPAQDRRPEGGAVRAIPAPPRCTCTYRAGETGDTVLKLGGGFTVELRNGLYGEIQSVLGAGALLSDAGGSSVVQSQPSRYERTQR